MKLSVVMMAYNQGKFIDDAIASVFAQHLPFEWELLIGDDLSMDETEQIVSMWKERHPKEIVYERYTKNLGLHRNYEMLVTKAKGEYIALLEADDYWLDEMKTFKQVAFMDQNPDVAWCSTNGVMVNERGAITKTFEYSFPEKFGLEYFLAHFFNPLNNSTVIRRSMEPLPFPDYFFTVKQWDTVLFYLRSLRGNIGFLPINGMAWRRHENATSFSTEFSGSHRFMDWITINREIGKLVPLNIAREHFNNTWAYERLAVTSWGEGKILSFIRFTFLMIATNPNGLFKRCRDFVWRFRNA